MIKCLFTFCFIFFFFIVYGQVGVGVNLSFGVSNEIVYPGYNDGKAIISKASWMPGLTLKYQFEKMNVNFNYAFGNRNYKFNHYYRDELGFAIPVDFDIKIPVNRFCLNLNYIFKVNSFSIQPGLGIAIEHKGAYLISTSDQINNYNSQSVNAQNPIFLGVSINIIANYRVFENKNLAVESFIKPEYFTFFSKNNTDKYLFKEYVIFGLNFGVNFLF